MRVLVVSVILIVVSMVTFLKENYFMMKQNHQWGREWKSSASIFVDNSSSINSSQALWEHLMNNTLTVTRNSSSSTALHQGRTKKMNFSACDPFSVPSYGPESETTNWMNHHRELVHTARSAASDLDILFLGDSIIEHWNGTKWLGRRLRPTFRDTFQRQFSKARGAKYEGLALGSAGDSTHYLNWHIQNGLLPETLNPKIIWILIGTNNFFDAKNCATSEKVLSSIMEVAYQVHQRKPKSKIVVQAMLPRGDTLGSFSVGGTWKAIQETNRRLASISIHFPQLYFADMGKYFLKQGGIVSRDLSDDGVHPSEKGFVLLGKRVQTFVDQIL